MYTINDLQIVETTEGMPEDVVLTMVTEIVKREQGKGILVDLFKMEENRYRVILYLSTGNE